MKIKELKKPLKLKNNGALEIFFLGTGTAFSKLYNNNIIIIKGNTSILVDFGITGPRALGEVAGLSYKDISTLLPTHSHADHIGGIENLALHHRYLNQNHPSKLKIIINEEYQKVLWDRSLRGGMEWNESNYKGTKLTFDDYFEAVRPDIKTKNGEKNYSLDYNGIKLEFVPTNHIPDNAKTVKQAFISFGLFIDGKVLFTGDTKFDPEIINKYSKKAEIIFHDCSFTDNPVHTPLSKLRTLPDELKKRIYLMHFEDNWKDIDVKDFAGLAQSGVRYIFD